jgi:proton-translocating NADH-quinone oxidoreductase, chain L
MFLSLLFLPLIGFLLIIVLGRFVNRYFLMVLNLSSLIVAIFFSLYLLLDMFTNNTNAVIDLGNWISLGLFNIKWQFLFDTLSLTMTFLVLTISTFVHFYSWEYMGSDPHFLRFMSYLSIFTFFMLLFVTAGNFLQMFFGWEGVGLSSYLLINFWFTRLQANKSAMKAIIVNRISDLFLYFSIFTLFLVLGTVDYLNVFQIAGVTNVNSIWLTFITLCIFVGAVGKSAQLGLHTWLPDAMEGPTPVSALLHAATMVTAGVFLLIRCSTLLELTPFTLLLILFIGGLTTFMAGTIGCFQNDIKKVVAYSTCSQLGYMFLICGLGHFNVSFFHLFNHAFFKALLFLGSGSVIHALLDEQDIRKMGGLFKTLPITYISFFIASLALAGIPYLTGFYSKDLLIELNFATYTISSIFIYWLALFSVFFTSFYSTRLLYYVFLGWPNYQTFKVVESGNIIILVLVVLTFSSIFVGFFGRELFVGVGTDVWQQSINIITNNNFFETELSFILGGVYSKNKLFPLIITLLAVLIAGICLFFWSRIITNSWFRQLYTFINQKWYFDLIYFNFIVTPIMEVGYNITFKLVDRGVLEAFGSTSIYNQLHRIYVWYRSIFESGSLYVYITAQIILIVILLINF